MPERFFAAEEARLAQACWAMARRFHQGGRLLAFGRGAWATDAQHVSVEFVHPVIVGKRALPAIALTNDSALLSAEPPTAIFERQLALLARPADIALGFDGAGEDEATRRALVLAKERGLLTLALSGEAGALGAVEIDYLFCVPDSDLTVVQETHETLYHILWELVHIFFEHEGLLRSEAT